MFEAYTLNVRCRHPNRSDIDHSVRSWNGLNGRSCQSNARVVGIDTEVVVGVSFSWWWRGRLASFGFVPLVVVCVG